LQPVSREFPDEFAQKPAQITTRFGHPESLSKPLAENPQTRRKKSGKFFASRKNDCHRGIDNGIVKTKEAVGTANHRAAGIDE